MPVEPDKGTGGREKGTGRQCPFSVPLLRTHSTFLTNYGGGYFGYANIYSLDPDSYFYIGKHNKTVLDKLLFIADNECGDSYAFRIEDGKCDGAVAFYDHEKKKYAIRNFAISLNIS